MRHVIPAAVTAFAIAAAASPAAADPREILTVAAFQTRDRDAAVAQVNRAEQEAAAALAKAPNDRDALFERGMAIGYRAKLTRSLGDAQAARKIFESLARTDPRDAEAQAAVGTWHLDAVDQLGGMIARTALGARRQVGEAAIDRAVALGGRRALFPALAALVRIRADPDDIARARALAEQAGRGATPTAQDRILQRAAAAILVPLRAGDGKAAAQLARTLLPFGRLAK